MKIAAILGVLIILTVETDNHVIEDTREIHNSDDKRILLRKLQNFQQNNPKDTESVTWNEILADILVKEIRFSSKKVDGEEIIEKRNENILTKCFSLALFLYKNYVYDKIGVQETKQEDINKEVEEAVTIKMTVTTDDDDPKNDIEIIEPKYHGRLCTDCGEDENGESGETLEKCPEGYERNEEGKCVNAKLIFAVPNQCPIGYRRDRLGFCRIRF